MKILIPALAIIIVKLLIGFFRKSKEQPREAAPSRQQPDSNLYHDMRQMAFNAEIQKLGIVIPDDGTKVYGVITDISMSKAVATMVTYSTGDASLYLSSGGLIMGGGQHETVNKAARTYVNQAQGFLDKAMKTDETTLPEEGMVNFYLLTNKGKYLAIEKLSKLEGKGSELEPLFIGVNNVMTELRLIEQKRSRN